MTPELRAAWRFFHQHAGYCTPPGAVACAMNLARAERWARRNGATFEWVDDPEGCGCEKAHPAEGCILTIHGDDSISLWGICGATPEYRRVVEAELASEAFGVVCLPVERRC